ncbi:phosphodiester glycosidase family protein [Neomegalonema sp.]|uniref:phosphodiester glycosidase family protein n=1 Tax=Neomegalonema sp. TaxID=2039713 RepID=UPI00261B5C6E|nr:phosphodiester glycosidase family protein [Neomegalonema sp.]MDD2868609.1 phosphodiester glycosidase family protein [Neomegalonema sp.]
MTPPSRAGIGRRLRRAWASLALLWAAAALAALAPWSAAAQQAPREAPAEPAACRAQIYESGFYKVCRYDPAKMRLALFNLDPAGQPFGAFGTLRDHLAAQGERIVFAFNAGMFDEALKPIGLYIEAGRKLKALNRRAGYGNFHLKPNGVFYIREGRPGVLETEAYARRFEREDVKPPEYATQSGPMLVVDGKIHPAFMEDSASRKFRNGVGVTAGGEAIFVISDLPVTFHAFGRFFRDGLKTPNALFLDGSLSSLFSPELRRDDRARPLGPMVAAIARDAPQPEAAAAAPARDEAAAAQPPSAQPQPRPRPATPPAAPPAVPPSAP